MEKQKMWREKKKKRVRHKAHGESKMNEGYESKLRRENEPFLEN